MTASAIGSDDQAALPFVPLRTDITMHAGAELANGAPSWVLHDHWRDQFYRISRREVEILARWHLADVGAICADIAAHTPLCVSPEDVAELQRFVINERLCQTFMERTDKQFSQQHANSQKSPLTWLIHNYLFVKIPLVKPDSLLNSTLPWVRWMLQPGFIGLVFVLGLVGLFLVSRQWDSFSTTFMAYLDWRWAVMFAAAMVVVKLCHELGHAYTAKYFGIKVPTMGVALLVLWPVLYTDTSHAWLLPKRRQRLLIGAAGILVELMLACVATLAWVLLPDGLWRSVAFFIAAVSWLTSFAVNLNPFMRFDGYYLLADWLEVDNLQSRSFALGRWYLREKLFAWGVPCPEADISNKQVGWLVVYAYLTWVYRLFLFVGIALLVYYLFFKVLGIVLFIVEIVWFVLLPIGREIWVWWQQRQAAGLTMRKFILLSLLAGLGALISVPWDGRVSVPAVVRPAEFAHIYAPTASKLVAIHIAKGDKVRKGQLLMELENADLKHQIKLAQDHKAAIAWRLRRAALDTGMGDNRLSLQEQYLAAQRQLAGLLEQQAKLQVLAPNDGYVEEIATSLQPGRWLGTDIPLVYIANGDQWVVEGYVTEQDLQRIKTGMGGTLYWHNGSQRTLPLVISRISATQVQLLSQPYLASVFGGPLAVVQTSEGLVPQRSLYRVIMTPAVDKPRPLTSVSQSTVVLQGQNQSWIQSWYEHILAILVRESGF